MNPCGIVEIVSKSVKKCRVYYRRISWTLEDAL